MNKITLKEYLWLRGKEAILLKKLQKTPELFKIKSFSETLRKIQWNISLYEADDLINPFLIQ